MRVLVCTVVHHPEDARILHRQIRALLDAGHQVVYAAPFTACGVRPWPQVTPLDLPRAVGRSRSPALRAARRALARHGGGMDLLVLHDPELLVLLPLLPRGLPPVVWDVHEDTAAALATKHWLPTAMRPALRPLLRATEAVAERRVHLLLAESGYRTRFRRYHPVVPNSTYIPDAVPDPGADRVVYVGQLSRARGAAELVETARTLHRHGVRAELVGTADPDARDAVTSAERDGLLCWHGFVPNDQALSLAEGALAGLSLLHDMPNYRQSQPTKVMEYMARGVPVVTTPIPAAAEVVTRRDCGIVVPFGDPRAVAAAVLRLRDDPALRRRMARRGREAARELFCWTRDSRYFVKQLEEWAADAGGGRPAASARRRAWAVTRPRYR